MEQIPMLKEGWHKERGGEIVWAEGWEYTETGNAPGRVQVIRMAGGHGPIRCWAWDSELTPIGDESEAKRFVDSVRRYNSAKIAMLQNDIEAMQGNTRKWEARAAFSARGSHEG